MLEPMILMASPTSACWTQVVPIATMSNLLTASWHVNIAISEVISRVSMHQHSARMNPGPMACRESGQHLLRRRFFLILTFWPQVANTKTFNAELHYFRCEEAHFAKGKKKGNPTSVSIGYRIHVYLRWSSPKSETPIEGGNALIIHLWPWTLPENK